MLRRRNNADQESGIMAPTLRPCAERRLIPLQSRKGEALCLSDILLFPHIGQHANKIEKWKLSIPSEASHHLMGGWENEPFREKECNDRTNFFSLWIEYLLPACLALVHPGRNAEAVLLKNYTFQLEWADRFQYFIAALVMLLLVPSTSWWCWWWWSRWWRWCCCLRNKCIAAKRGW